MTLKKVISLFVILSLMLCALPLAATAQTGEDVNSAIRMLSPKLARPTMARPQPKMLTTDARKELLYQKIIGVPP